MVNYGFLKVESPAFPHPLTPAPGRGQRGIWGRRRRQSRLLLPQTPFLRKPCLLAPIQPVTAVIDRARRLATVKTSDREIVLRDVPTGEIPYNLLQQVNAILAQGC